jgi:CheY-like chemotaxis protein
VANPAILVLVVEDDAIQREGMRTVLERAGYAVALAAGLAEAMTRLGEMPVPDLVLLDMLFPRSPEGDGWHFLRERQRRPDIAAVPVVLTTALGNASAEWAESLGAQGYLRKPIDIEPLLTEVRQLLAGK